MDLGADKSSEDRDLQGFYEEEVKRPGASLVSQHSDVQFARRRCEDMIGLRRWHSLLGLG